MMDPGVRAWQVMRCIKTADYESLRVLPGWVREACTEARLFLTNQDDYSALWVLLPPQDVFHDTGDDVTGILALRANPSDILLNHGQGYIGVLTEIT